MNKILYIFCIAILLLSCEEENFRIPDFDDSTPPGAVKNISVKNMAGAAIITYTIPTDDDLLYIIAEYNRGGDETIETRVSAYTNQIVVEGFIDTMEREVKLYAVDKNENRSEAVTAVISPLKAPYLKTFESFAIIETFGGAVFKWENNDLADLEILLFATDSLGVLELVKATTSNSVSGQASLRGYDPEEKIFAAIIRDRWGNISDTIKKTLTPWFEAQIPSSAFIPIKLPGDCDLNQWGGRYEYLYDGSLATMAHSWDESPWPLFFTLDLGKPLIISRFKFWQRNEDALGGSDTYYGYTHYNMKDFELYGRSDAPPADGSWDGWNLIGEFITEKPSGLPGNQMTDEDVEVLFNGHEHEMPIDMPEYRYFRLKVSRNWDDSKHVNILEIAFFGNYTED